MRKNSSPTNADLTPSKMKLKQARLPFKLISDVSPKSVSPQTSKRKVSATDLETAPKIAKISKKSNLIEDLVVISDDDSKDGAKLQKDYKIDKLLNPYVKLVDNARQKKRKSKKKQNKKSKVTNYSAEAQNECVSDSADNKKLSDVEMMVAQEPTESDDKSSSIDRKNDYVEQIITQSESISPKKTRNHRQPVKSIEACNEGNITVVEEATDASNIKVTDSKVTEKENMVVYKSTEITEKEVQITPIVVTPKRSSRNKAKEEKSNLNSSISDSKLDESVCSNTTPKHDSQSSVPDDRDESLNESTFNNTSTNLTPKQLQKKQEVAKKKEERDKEKQEREKKRQQEKEERAKQKLEKEEQKKREREEKEEARRKEKEEKEELKRKEKEEKERQKELERKLKDEKEEQKRKEREEKEEQKRKEKELKEEEKRKKQEALEQEKIEQELKKKKTVEAFVNFFVPKQKADKDQNAIAPVSKSSVLSSFTIKADMRLAPTIRSNLSEKRKETLDSALKEQISSEKELYLGNLKEVSFKPEASGKTWPLSDKYDDDDDVVIVEDELPLIDGADEILSCDNATREKLRPKLLSFHENRRPPYWGTWRKQSSFVKPRRPFGQDEKQLDYEVDSDDEWEEEEGESIEGSAAGSDDEPDDEYEVDHEVFVPHGYLSDEEATMDDDDVLSLSPETQKARLKHLEDEFESEMKKPTEKLKPRLYGLLWETNDGGKPEKCVDALWNYFKKMSMIMNDPTSLLQPSSEPEELEKKKVKKKKIESEKAEQSPKSEKKRKSKAENKESKKIKIDKKNTTEVKNQPGINSFLTKIKGA